MTSWLRTIFVIAALAYPSSAVYAAGTVDEHRIGPKVGATVPQTLKVRDQNNQYQDFKSLARRKGLIVLFSRSLSW